MHSRCGKTRSSPSRFLGVLWLLIAASCALDEPVPGDDAAPTAAEPTGLRSLALELPWGVVAGLEVGDASATDALVLLHGARFSSRTWSTLGTLAVPPGEGPLAGGPARIVALDLPGYGGSAPMPSSEGNREGESSGDLEPGPASLVAILDRLGIARALLVVPSMSGCFALPLLHGAPDRLLGMVPIAPACGEPFPPLEGSIVPVLILWGEDDAVLDVAGAAALSDRLGGATVEVFEGASHPCYLDQPDRFHVLLASFWGQVAAGG